MKDKMKKFVEEHKTAIIVIGVGAAALTCGVIGYKLGGKEFEAFRKSVGDNDEFIEKLLTALKDSDDCYFRTLGPENIVKFKGIGDLAQEAIDLDESASIMEDNIVGLFVLTRPEG